MNANDLAEEVRMLRAMRVDLERQVKDLRAREAAERARADRAEDSARRAWQLNSWTPPRRRAAK